MAMGFDALDEEYQEDFRSRHYQTRIGEEAYDFNIKVYRVNIPKTVRHVLSDQLINKKYEEEAFERLGTLRADLKFEYDWIADVGQEGRSGGWLVVITNEPAFIDSIRLGYVRKRIRDLRAIEKKVEIAKKNFVAMMEDPDWWEIGPRDWSPRWKNK